MKTIESRMLLSMEKSLFKYRGVFKTQANISWKFLRKQLTAESHELFSFKASSQILGWFLITPMKQSKMYPKISYFSLNCVKSVQIRSFFSPYFPVFELKTERYSVSLRIQSECGKIRTRKNSIFGNFSRSPE